MADAGFTRALRLFFSVVGLFCQLLEYDRPLFTLGQFHYASRFAELALLLGQPSIPEQLPITTGGAGQTSTVPVRPILLLLCLSTLHLLLDSKAAYNPG